MQVLRTYPKQADPNILQQALSEQVPDMLNGFIITTSFGSINIDAEFAEAFRNLAADVLQYQLNQIVANQTTRIEL
ncbi:MAG: hypothetical protein PHI97_25300, partial [Desulfobulbus sp.]|nr:hypothetical protein [Desulfobulbus sp.]